MGAVLRSYLVLAACGWAVLPVLLRLLRPLPDRGYAVSRLCGWTIATWTAYALASLLGQPLNGAMALAALGLVAFACWGVEALLRHREGHAPPACALRVDGLRGRWSTVVCIEALCLAGTMLFVAIQADNPAIDPDSERFMEYALLKAYLRAPGLPIEDPWFAGEPINYYAFTYAAVGFLVRASGSEARYLFPVAVALVHGLLWVVVFGLGLALSGRWRGGFLAAFLVLGAGNFEWLHRWWVGGGGPIIDWFSPARAIEGTITEFPWFSLLWGDLHPYVFALPLVAGVLTFAVALEDAGEAASERGRGIIAARGLGCGLFTAILMAAHPWDVPLALLAASGIALACAGWRRALLPPLATAMAIPLVLPFLRGFQQSGRRLALVERMSGVGEWLAAYGPFVLLGLAGLVTLRRKPGRPTGKGPPETGLRAAVVLGAAAVLGALACEVVFVPDIFAGTPLARMNTVFKIYRLSWLFLGLSGAVLVEAILRRHGRRGSAPATVVVFIAIVTSAAYPLLGTRAWHLDLRGARAVTRGAALKARWPGDAEAVFRALLPDDAAVTDYLAAHARPGEAIAEESGEAYSWSSRIATFSGVPTLLGWANHEAGWRNGWGRVLERRAALEAIYRQPDSVLARQAVRRYRVRWVVVGQRERLRYGGDGLEWLERHGEKVMRSGSTTLFRLDENRD